MLQSQLSRRAFLGVHREQVQQKVTAAFVSLRHTLPNAGLLWVQILVAVLRETQSISAIVAYNKYFVYHAIPHTSSPTAAYVPFLSPPS
jgi:hypothetical protein